MFPLRPFRRVEEDVDCEVNIRNGFHGWDTLEMASGLQDLNPFLDLVLRKLCVIVSCTGPARAVHNIFQIDHYPPRLFIWR